MAIHRPVLYCIWVTLILGVIAIICFALSTTNGVTVYIGAVSITLAAITALTACVVQYMSYTNKAVCQCCRGHSDGAHSCLVALTDCIDSCTSKMLCLDNPSNRQQLQQLEEVLARHQQMGYVDEQGAAVLQANMDLRAQSRQLEMEVGALFTEYGELVEVVNSEALARDYQQLQRCHDRLAQWIEGSKIPIEQEMDQVRHKMRNVQRHFQLVRQRALDVNNRNSVHSVSNTPAAVTTPQARSSGVDSVSGQLPVTPIVVGTFPIPPPYMLDDPHPEARAQAQAEVRDNVQNLYRQTQSSYLQGPPQDETGAPPTYEDATSTTV